MARSPDYKSKFFDISLREPPKLDHKVATKIDGETYLKLLDLTVESGTNISYILRKAINYILWIGPKYFEFIEPMCPECGGPLSGILATSKLTCVKCGRVYKLKALKEEGEGNGN